MTADWTCKVCNGEKRATMRKFREDNSFCEDVLGVHCHQISDYKKEGYITTEVFCGECGLMYHHDTV